MDAPSPKRKKHSLCSDKNWVTNNMPPGVRGTVEMAEGDQEEEWWEPWPPGEHAMLVCFSLLGLS